MSRKATLPQSRRHVWIFNEDWEWAQKYVETHDGLTAGLLVRHLFHKFVLQQKERQATPGGIENAKLQI